MDIHKKSIFEEEKKKGIVYFCPRCRFIAKSPREFNTDKKNSYKCPHPDCKKPMFKQQTFIDERMKYKKYHTLDTNLTVKELRKNIIAELYNRGFSSRDINELTHFSRKKIQKIIEENTYTRIMTVGEFYRDVLPFADGDSPIEIIRETIIDFLSFGFSHRDLSTLLDISYPKLIELIGTREIDYRKKHRVKLLEDGSIRYTTPM